MEIDNLAQEFVFTSSDQWAMGHPHIPLEKRVPVSEGENLLGRAMDIQTVISSIDPSEFPAGANRNKLISEKMRRTGLINDIINSLVEFNEESVVRGAETWLRENS